MTGELTDSSLEVPLIVDLDDTILKTDCLYEALALSLKKRPLLVFKFFWLCIVQGRSNAKQWLSENIELDFTFLPLNLSVVKLLKDQPLERPIYLATASPKTWASGFANRLLAEEGISFKNIWTSEGATNLKGSNKAALLINQFGVRGFDYIGDSRSDFGIWCHSRRAYAVTSCSSFKTELNSKFQNLEFIQGRSPAVLVTIAKQLRIHQWIKNLLIFFPLVAAHKITDITVWMSSILAFTSFSLSASAVYILNDMCDLENDRKHRTKKNRPLASGELPIVKAALMSPLLVTGSLAMAFVYSSSLFTVLLGYLTMTTLYSFWLKRRAMVDIVVLSGLYTVRVIAGAVATDIPVSTWLFAFSMFFFFSLACAKRFSELGSNEELKQKVPGRGYFYGDRDLIGLLGVSSSVTSVLVLAMYVTANEVVSMYPSPKLLLLLCPLVLLWISRIWLTAFRDQLDDDPIVYALRYRGSYIIGLACVVVLALSSR